MATIDEATAAEVERKEFISTVAESLEFRLGLPNGRGLVGVIGDGHERTNRQAIKTWVAKHWNDDQPEDARAATEMLEAELVMTLQDMLH